MQISSDDDRPRFIEGAVVRLTKDAAKKRDVSKREEMAVKSHSGGTVRTTWLEKGEWMEGNFSAMELEAVKG